MHHIRKTRFGSSLRILVVGVAVLSLAPSPANAVKTIDHPMFGASLTQICDRAYEQLDGVVMLNTDSTESSQPPLAPALTDIGRVYTQAKTKLLALHPGNPDDRSVLAALNKLVADELKTFNAAAKLARAKQDDKATALLTSAFEKYTPREQALSVRLTATGNPSCAILSEPDVAEQAVASTPTPASPTPASTDAPTTPNPDTTTSAVPVAPAAERDVSRFFAPIPGYTYVRSSAEQEKAFVDSLTASPDIVTGQLRTVVDSNARAFGALTVIQTAPGALTDAVKADFRQGLIESLATDNRLPKWSPQPPSGAFTDVTTVTVGGLDNLVAFRPDGYIVWMLATPSPGQATMLSFTNLLLPAIPN